MVNLKQPFKKCYYLCENGTVYNSDTDTIIKPDKRHNFILSTEAGERKSISLRKLYRELYNKEYCIDNIQDLEGEQWKEIIDTKGKYLVSNKGRIKSLQQYKAMILNPYVNQGKYLRVDISIDGSRTSVLVHKLVAAAFLPLPNRIDMQIHHKDLNKNNNAADNLEWLTAADHRKKHNERRNLDASTEPEENIHKEG